MQIVRLARRIPLIVATALVLAACGSSAVQTVDPNTFDAQTKTAGVVTLDVRSASEFAAGHIANAINIDVEAPTFDAEIAKLDKTVTYAVYCHSGRRSGIATAKMADAGFTNLYNLDGGIIAWQTMGLPLAQG